MEWQRRYNQEISAVEGPFVFMYSAIAYNNAQCAKAPIFV